MFFEVLVMMLLGGWAGGTLGWLFTLNVSLMTTAGAVYGFSCYVVWRIIVNSNEAAIERTTSESEPLMPESAFLALVFPLGVLAFAVVGIAVLTLAFVMATRKRNRPMSSH